MKSNFLKENYLLIAVAAVVFAISCAEDAKVASIRAPATDDVEKDKKKNDFASLLKLNSQAFAADNVTELPKCKDFDYSPISFVKGSGAFYYCNDSDEWTEINLKGESGAAGVAGPVGPAGPIGPAGPAGAQGPAGPAGGPIGPVGPAGPIGPVGPAGVAGPVGPAGLQGPAGPAGVAGPVGPAGAQGPKGNKGDTGAEGPRGPIGATGAPGIVVSSCEYKTLNNIGVTNKNNRVSCSNNTQVIFSHLVTCEPEDTIRQIGIEVNNSIQRLVTVCKGTGSGWPQKMTALCCSFQGITPVGLGTP
jgi:hypothetical protein